MIGEGKLELHHVVGTEAVAGTASFWRDIKLRSVVGLPELKCAPDPVVVDKLGLEVQDVEARRVRTCSSAKLCRTNERPSTVAYLARIWLTLLLMPASPV